MRLHLSETDKKIGGVCGGIAETIGVDSTIVRVVAALLFIISFGFMFVAYIIIWAIFPNGNY